MPASKGFHPRQNIAALSTNIPRNSPKPAASALDMPSSAHDTSSRPHLHTPAEAAQLLTVRESWLRRQAGVRAVPCTLLGKHLRFSDADLHSIIASGARPARYRR